MRLRVARGLIVIACTVSVFTIGAPPIHAVDPGGVITEYPVDASPVAVTVGSDGNLWYSSIITGILRVTTTGEVTQFPLPTPGTTVLGITTGADGNAWFAEWNQFQIGRITPAGVVTEFPLPPSTPIVVDLTLGPDGNVWGVAGEQFVKVATDGTITAYPGVSGGAISITAGPDGNLWFLEQNANKVGRLTTSGVVDAEFAIPTPSSAATFITNGPDGKLWFTEPAANKIASITTDGQNAEFPAGTNCRPGGIAADSDGRLWVTCGGEPTGIGVMTTDGTFRQFPTPTPDSQPGGITEGPDGNMWFAEFNGHNVAKVGTGPFPPTPPAPSAPAPIEGAPTFTG